MTIGSPQDIEGLRAAGWVVAHTLKEMAEQARPGMTTAELDALGAEILERHGARSAPQLCYDFPGATCISLNEEAAHGVPGDRTLQKGDVVNVDVSAELDGYFADTGGSFLMPGASAEMERLCAATLRARDSALAQVRAGQPLNVIGRAIQQTARLEGFKVLRNLGSHGVGATLHEEPRFIPPYFDPHDDRVLEDGQVITIEPFLSTHASRVREGADGWTLSGPRKNRSAQYEHTLVVTKDEPLILTKA
ncbi:type I methionyl aminopeptidase [Thiohalorhabdus methylotrophus]|uniref:Methionine aminopeptidase n=1 Tax=Thiohalorhabdus methylotrophus TaxID=3242694 RepID=A0ABV4TPD2_9GAMM